MALRWSLLQALGEERNNGQDTYDVFNYDRNPDIEDYYASFLRSRYGGPVVEVPAETAWRDPPEITDDAETDAETDTEFEQALAELVSAHRLWNYGKRADVLAGIGEYGVLVLELDDINGPDGFQKKASSASNLTGLRPFSQQSIEDIDTGNPGSGRWGEPVSYTLDLEDEDDTGVLVDDNTGPSQMEVHHTRVIHVPSDGLLDDEVRGQPRQEGVWNTLTDIEKTLGSAAEVAYRASAWGLSINIDKDATLDNPEEFREHTQRWYHGLEPMLRLQGAEAESLGGEDIDPAPIVDPNIEALAARTGIPQKVLRGNESGEVAGSQDLQEFYGKIQERREQFVTPMIVRALIDRLVELGVLPSAAGGGYEVDWPALAEQDEEQEATIQKNRSQVARNLKPIISSYDDADWKQVVEEGEFPDIEEPDGSGPATQINDGGYSIVDRAETQTDAGSGSGQETDAPADD